MGAIAAAQLPKVRDDLVKFCSTQNYIGMILGKHVMDGGDIDLPMPEAGMAGDYKGMVRTYETRLTNLARDATLFHATAEMTEVADTARQTMPGYRLHREDLPAERGLIVFDKPIGAFNGEGDPELMSPLDRQRVAELGQDNIPPTNCIAVLWGPAVTRDGLPGVLVVTWADNSELAAFQERQGAAPEAVAIMRSFGVLSYHDETVLPFGDMYDQASGPDRPVRNEALGTLLATWLLMGQPIVSTAPEPLPRQQRRALQRAGKPIPPVHVVRLRMPKQPAREKEDGVGRVYTRRWVVQGHWRNQWYPSRNDHRPIYVPAHIKGPEGAQLIGTQKVYDWRR